MSVGEGRRKGFNTESRGKPMSDNRVVVEQPCRHSIEYYAAIERMSWMTWKAVHGAILNEKDKFQKFLIYLFNKYFQCLSCS